MQAVNMRGEAREDEPILDPVAEIEAQAAAGRVLCYRCGGRDHFAADCRVAEQALRDHIAADHEALRRVWQLARELDEYDLVIDRGDVARMIRAAVTGDE